MNKKKIIILMTAVGLIGTSAVAGASDLVKKVSGVLHKDIVVSVDGEATSMEPIYINGKAYLPARDAAAALGYNLSWSSQSIKLDEKEEQQPVDYVKTMGVIVDVQATDKEGSYRIELLGHGSYSWIILYADEDTVITDQNGLAVAAKDLKAGTSITADFGPIIAMSFPGQSHAAKIVTGTQRLINDEVIQSVEKTDDGWQVQFGEMKDGKAVPTLTLNAGKETSVMTSQGESVEWADVKAGTKVTAYYGPIMTKSIPPQSPLFYLIVPAETNQLAPASVQEFRELAWSQISEDAKTHLTTQKDEAVVEFIDSLQVTLLGTSDEQQKKLSEIQAASGKLITVTYNTDDDMILGPKTLAFDPDSKMYLGSFPRK